MYAMRGPSVFFLMHALLLIGGLVCVISCDSSKRRKGDVSVNDDQSVNQSTAPVSPTPTSEASAATVRYLIPQRVSACLKELDDQASRIREQLAEIRSLPRLASNMTTGELTNSLAYNKARFSVLAQDLAHTTIAAGTDVEVSESVTKLVADLKDIAVALRDFQSNSITEHDADVLLTRLNSKVETCRTDVKQLTSLINDYSLRDHAHVISETISPTPPPPTPLPYFATDNFRQRVDLSGQMAVIAYPDLKITGTPLNNCWWNTVRQLNAANSDVLHDYDWPMKVADQCAAQLGITSSIVH
jgi:hypothetical protein